MSKIGNYALSILIALSAIILSSAASAGAFMPTGKRTSQPIGHFDFCQLNPQECQKINMSPKPVELTRDVWTKITEINHHVNSTVVPMTDMEIWGREEVWSYPNGVGDCEDYALEKQRLLRLAGIPASNLFITVARQKNGEGHAVLTVRTSRGDFILDNLEEDVMAWDKTNYRLLKRQAEYHAGIWVSIEDGRDVAVGSTR